MIEGIIPEIQEIREAPLSISGRDAGKQL